MVSVHDTSTAPADPRSWADSILTQTGQRLAGMEEAVKLCLVAYVTGGHVLLEGNPGLGKTTLVKVLADALRNQWGRIQFTPDLMPSDITGTMLPDYENGNTGRWVFGPGAIFASLLLADEINRATPKTQSALLEAMAEGQVTVLGRTYRLPVPFMVLATQNPLDQHTGTYKLPEAQTDRFLFKINAPIPDEAGVKTIIDINGSIVVNRPAPSADGVADTVQRILFNAYNVAGASIPPAHKAAEATFAVLAKTVERLPLGEHLRDHLAAMFLASQGRAGRAVQDADLLAAVVAEVFPSGLSPRAIIGMAKASKAWALLFDARQVAGAAGMTVNPTHLARVALPALLHRGRLPLDWERLGKGTVKKRVETLGYLNAGDPLLSLLAFFCHCTAPADPDYRKLLQASLQAAIRSLAVGPR